MSDVTLVIGNKNYSSWSLRAWLVLRKAGVAFEERRLQLDTPAFEEEIGELSPNHKVPVLWHRARCVWDSLAIAEYANEEWAEGKLWPGDTAQRAHARSISAEMHSGLSHLRSLLPMNCRASDRFVPMEPGLAADIHRVFSIWRECREQSRDAGPWLFGSFSIADAMYAPVALRFNTYGIEMPDIVHNYVETVLHDIDVSEWVLAARQEVEVVEADEAGV